MVEEYEEIAESQYLSERLEYLDEDYGRTLIRHLCGYCSRKIGWFATLLNQQEDKCSYEHDFKLSDRTTSVLHIRKLFLQITIKKVPFQFSVSVLPSP